MFSVSSFTLHLAGFSKEKYAELEQLVRKHIGNPKSGSVSVKVEHVSSEPSSGCKEGMECLFSRLSGTCVDGWKSEEG